MYQESNEQLSQELIEMMKERAYKNYGTGDIKRSAHTKALAILQGRFEVAQDLPQALRVGNFREPKAYDVWIRISNSSMKAQKDYRKDVRGFAMKLETAEGVQDFILVSTKYMPIRSIKGFHGGMSLMSGIRPLRALRKIWQDINFKVLFKLALTIKHETSPLDVQYFSVTPYAFGHSAVKYALVPTSGYRSKRPLWLTPTYLRDNMKKHLASQEATFDFLVQFQQEGMSLEDASQIWNQKLSPYIKVGKLTIPMQEFDTLIREQIGEELTYSPAHARGEHFPLGELNKARMHIYEAMQVFRKKP
ncbi:MAG: catalase [Cellulosilyticaceae bacterium]